VRGQSDDGDVLSGAVRFEPLGCLPPVDLGNRDVHEDQIRQVFLCPADAFFAITRFQDAETYMLQNRTVDHEVVLVVLDEQNGFLFLISHYLVACEEMPRQRQRWRVRAGYSIRASLTFEQVQYGSAEA
jgi:hypothetical protein